MRFRVVAVSGKVLSCLAFIGLFATLVAAQSETPAPAVPPAPLAIGPGDAAVSGFSGAGLAEGTLPPGVNPLDKTVITLANPALKILDLSFVGGAPAGELLSPSVKFAVPAKDIGQVFALAFDAGTADAPPNLYAAATSLYGLSVVAEKPGPDGQPVRLKAGAPGARFMQGQFGPDATPGAIWKIDGATGSASLFAETVDGGAANSGPALGDIAIDAKSKSLFASDLDTGLIHRFPLDGGADVRTTFDHGVNGRPAAQLPAVADDKKRADIASASFNPGDPATWGFTQPERRIDGLAVRDGRLFYAVAAGPEVWSIALAADGSFGSDPRREVEIKADKPSVVSDIAFDADGRMIVALRGALQGTLDYRQFVAPEAGAVLRFSPKAGAAKPAWATSPETYAVGSTSNTATGGIALGYAYTPEGTLDFGKCSATLGATGDALPVAGASTVNGAQVMGAELVLPAKAPDKSVLVEFDVMQNDKALTGHVGDIEIFQPCDGTQFPAVAGGPGAAPGSGAGAAPGGFPDGSPDGFAEGVPGGGGLGGGFPADGAPEEGVAEAPVDPNAPRTCSVSPSGAAGANGPLSPIDAAAADGLAVKNVNPPTCTPNPDGKTKKCRFPVAFENMTDAAQVQSIRFRTEPPPQAPLGSETPGAGGGIRGDGAFFIGSGKVEPGQTGTPIVFAGDYLIDEDPVGQPSVDRTPRISHKESPTCQPPQNGERICSVPLAFENPSQLDNPKIDILSNKAPKRATISRGDQISSPTGTSAAGATTTTFDTSFRANSKEDLVATVVLPDGADTNFAVRINEESIAAAEKLAEERANSMAGGDQSCVALDTTNPDAPSTPTNEPTLPPVEPGPQACVPPTPTKPLLLTGGLLSPIPKCTQFPSGRKDCEWVFQMTNKSELAESKFDAKFSVPPSKVRDGTSAPRLSFTSAQGAPATDFDMTARIGSGILSTTIVGEFPPGKPGDPDPTLEVTMPKSTRDAAKAAGPAPGADVQLDFPEDACVTAENETPDAPPPGVAAPRLEPRLVEPPPRLVVKKSPPSETHCPINGPCVFKIEVTNAGSSDYVGPLTVKEFLPIKGGDAVPQSMRLIAASEPGWNCRPTGEVGLDCNPGCKPPEPGEKQCVPADVRLPKGETAVILIETVAGDSWKNTNTIVNCAQIVYDGMSQQPSEEHNSCASAPLDPFNVAVAKTGGQSCQPGKECTFELDIFNPTNNIPHKDPVTVTDKLAGIGNAPILSLTAAAGADPFPCNPPPTQAPFTCTGHMELDPSEHNKYTLVVRIPDDAPTSGTFTNCAGVGKDATAATPGTTDDVCHTTKLEPASPDAKCPEGWTGSYPQCTAPQVSGGPSSTGQEPLQNVVAPGPTGGMSPTGEPTCFGGMILVSGGCRCPAPTVLNGSTGMCVAAPACPDGYDGAYPYCRLGPTGGSFATALPESPRDRRTSTTPTRRGGGSTTKPTGGSSATVDSQRIKTRREAGEPRPPRHRRDPRPPPTGGMSATGAAPPGTKLCRGRKVPLSFNCVPKAVGKVTPTSPAAVAPNKPPKAVGKVTPNPPAAPPNKPPKAVGKVSPKPPIKAVGKRDPRINYGSSVNDRKPNLGGVR